MPIQILPARLANQIAAGEVVERPASVVKELVENSLDAGATRIDIDIDKGGSRTIRIRDNGCGIPKDELSLALSRHATSKIATLDDLEAILSLGFRGEALASISSVSRLTLTSRTVAQEEAWSAYAEGRDMEVQLKPAAHPVGTTLEVLDLFFNTPARRKFLRTEKTEFGHIDELLKRIALSRMDVSFNLRHNGKMIRQYRAATTQIQKERRLAAICGGPFLDHALAVELEHGGFKLTGWICTPQGARSQNDIQYCYVNGRMMKDKLINHAIRQAYETSLAPDQYAAYVLFIEVDPHQVDVNVHPAKHEVRFHQARLVHDFICQGLQSALIEGAGEAANFQVPAPRASAQATPSPAYPASQSASYQVEEPSVSLAAAARTPDYPNKAPTKDWMPSSGSGTGRASAPSSEDNGRAAGPREPSVPSREQMRPEAFTRPSGSPATSRPRGEDGPSPQEVAAYQRLLQTAESAERPASHYDSAASARPASERSTSADVRPAMSSPSGREPSSSVRPAASQPPSAVPAAAMPARVTASTALSQNAVDGSNGIGLGKALCMVAGKYLLLSRDEGVALLSLERAAHLRCKGQLRMAQSEGLKPQPLLIPHSVPVEPSMLDCAEQHALLLKQLGIQLKAKGTQHIVILSVSQPLRQQNLQQLIPMLLGYLAAVADDPQAQGWDKLLDWMSRQLVLAPQAFSLSQAIQLVTELEQLWGADLEHYYSELLRPVDLAAAIEAFDYD